MPKFTQLVSAARQHKAKERVMESDTVYRFESY